MVNARDCTLRAEWQCHPHCHSTSNVPRRCAQAKWQCRPRGAARSGPSGSATHTATRRRAYRNGTSRPEWQCRPRGAARSGPSGSAPYTATRRRTYGLHALTLPLDVERTGCTPSHCHSTSNARAARPHTATRRRAYQDGALGPEWQCRPHRTARSGPSGSAGSGGLRASSRCADARARLPDVSRASGSRALFETDPLRVVERLLARQVGMAVQLASPM